MTARSSAFSLARNIRALGQRGASDLPWVDGLRAVAILWVVEFHALFFIGKAVRLDPDREPLFRLVHRGLLGVDVFFVLSGFLIGGILLRELEETGTIALRRFYARRALRILPAYWVVLAVVALLHGNAERAWANVLFLNNFLPEHEQCMPWAWSLAIEEQFYVLLPLVLVLTARRPGAVLPALLALVLAVVVTRFAIVLAFDLHRPGPEHGRALYDLVYDKPHTRFAELLSGVVVAHVARRYDLGALRRRRFLSGALSLLAASVLVAVATARQPIFVYGASPAVNVLFFALSAPLFAAGVAWWMVACLAGAGGGAWLAQVLAWRPLRVVAQLSYATYLLHVLVFEIGLEVGPIAPARTSAAMAGWLVGAPVIALVTALPLHLLVERPFMQLRRSPVRGAAPLGLD